MFETVAPLLITGVTDDAWVRLRVDLLFVLGFTTNVREDSIQDVRNGASHCTCCEIVRDVRVL